MPFRSANASAQAGAAVTHCICKGSLFQLRKYGTNTLQFRQSQSQAEATGHVLEEQNLLLSSAAISAMGMFSSFQTPDIRDDTHAVHRSLGSVSSNLNHHKRLMQYTES